MSDSRNIVIRAGIGDVFSMIAVEGDGYSPDLADDLVARTRELFRTTLADAIELGYVNTDDGEGDFDDILEDGTEEDEEEVSTDGSKWWWVQ